MIKVTDQKTPNVESDSILIQEKFDAVPTPNGQLKSGVYYSWKGKWLDMWDKFASRTQALIDASLANYTPQVVWGTITGTLSNQTDLQSALNAKQDALTNPVTGTGATNELSYFTGTSTIGSLPTATYPSLTELSYVKGLTSAVQTQLDTKTFSVPFLANAFDPADAANYFFGGISNSLAPSTTNTNQDFVIGYPCTVVGCVIQAHGNVTQGSSEDVALSLRNNTTATTTSMGNFKTNATSSTTVVTAITGLNISVGASDSIVLQMNGTWATNPTQVRLTGYLIIRL